MQNQTKLTQFVKFLADQENASDGFSTKFLYETGTSKFNLKWKEVHQYFLKPHFKLSRGKFSGLVDNSDLESYVDEPVKAPVKKVAKKSAPKKAPVKKVAKKSALKQDLTKMVNEPMDPAAKAERLETIKQIAERHRAEDKIVSDLTA